MSSEDVRALGLDSVVPYELTDSHLMFSIEAPAMLIDEVKPAATVTGLTAAPGVGKTWLAMEMCRAVATGGKFLSAYQARQGAVLYVGSDSSLHDYARQWRRLTHKEWLSHVTLGEDVEHADNPLDSNVRFLIQSDFMLDNLDTIRRLIASSRQFEWGPEMEEMVGFEPSADGDLMIPVTRTSRRKGFDLVIFDTWSKLTSAEQNSNTLTEAAFRMVRFFSRMTGAACLILHHNAAKSEFNDGEGWRGATAGPGALDNHLQLTAGEQEKYLIKGDFKKFRGITPPPFFYEMNVSDEEVASLVFKEGSEVEKSQVVDEITDAVVGLLEGHRGVEFSMTDIVRALHPNFTLIYPTEEAFRRTVYTRIAAEKRKLTPRIHQEGGGNRGRRALYSAREVARVVAD